jgi:uncharacterized membrane protein
VVVDPPPPRRFTWPPAAVVLATTHTGAKNYLPLAALSLTRHLAAIYFGNMRIWLALRIWAVVLSQPLALACAASPYASNAPAGPLPRATP